MDFEEIEKSSDGTKKTVLYFAHPYCASERGINENHNRMCRRFYPKGTDFQKLEFRYLGRMLIFFIPPPPRNCKCAGDAVCKIPELAVKQSANGLSEFRLHSGCRA